MVAVKEQIETMDLWQRASCRIDQDRILGPAVSFATPSNLHTLTHKHEAHIAASSLLLGWHPFIPGQTTAEAADDKNDDNNKRE